MWADSMCMCIASSHMLFQGGWCRLGHPQSISMSTRAAIHSTDSLPDSKHAGGADGKLLGKGFLLYPTVAG